MATKEWTVSNDDLNIVAQFDRAGNWGTRRFYITEDGGYDKDAIQELGQTNIDMIELKKVLSSALKKSKVKKFDIIGFDACLMNTMEVFAKLLGEKTSSGEVRAKVQELKTALEISQDGYIVVQKNKNEGGTYE